MNQREVRQLSDDELFGLYSNSSPTTPPNDLYAAEIRRREFMAGRASATTARRIAWLTFWLVFFGALTAIAAGWPYLVWWATHGFRFSP
jgi:hypothetical protein